MERPAAERIDHTLYLHPQTLARLGSMELRAKIIVEGVTSGTHRSPYQGFSVEFAQHRPYVAGDDLRHLDWKVYGRTDKLYLKQYQQETNLDLVVMVDSSGSMAYGSRSFSEASGIGAKAGPRGQVNWTKYDHATALAAAISYITLRQGDRAGVVVFADQVRSLLSRSSSQRQWRQIIETLSQHPVEAPTDLSRVMDQTLAKIGNRCLIALVSDLFTDPAQIKTALARLRHRGHDLICFQIIDKAEETFEFTGPAPFEGLEGEARLRVDPRALRRAYLEAIHGHMREVERIVRSFGYEYETVRTHDWLGPPLAAFLARRNARIKRSKYG
ncbi:MAG: DUF58 domain-containing protein [Phycisphaeraceae bacterium]|nr:DUF58 domain-containing protein [Phycisphaeraceae bacterium]